MRSWKPIFFNGIFAANCLLVFLVLMESRLVVPAWLQVAGRMHPLVLHFPLVLLLLSAAWELAVAWKIVPADQGHFIGDGLLLATAATAVLAACCGLILSREPGYDADLLAWHKWSGILLSLLCLAWYSARQYLRRARLPLISASALGLLLLVITGHQGANITHGEDFLTAPIAVAKAERTKPAFENAVVFDDVILPILDAKCNGCHNARKAKGELVMDNAVSFLTGGKNGVLFDTTAADFGLLLQRIHLPLEDKKHMPPKGKPELTPEEMAILFYWIRSGAPMQQKLAMLPAGDSLRLLTAKQFEQTGPERYNFAPASQGAIDKLNNHYRLVAPIAAGSPALQASFFGRQAFSAEALKELQSVNSQLVSLNLSKMPVDDALLDQLTTFQELRELNLAFTGVTDAGVAKLSKLPNLKTVTVSGTALTGAGLTALTRLPAVKTIYCWSTAATASDLEKIAQSWPGIAWEQGFSADTIRVKLNPPHIENDQSIFTDTVAIHLKHFVQGAEMRYTTDGTEPDSVSSPLYDGKLLLSKSTTFKTRAFKKGWDGSETAMRTFYLKGKQPDTTWFRFQPDSGYQGKGTGSLFDGEKAGLNYREDKYLGFRNRPMDLYLEFEQPIVLSRLELSALVDISSYIFPAVSIEVSGTAGNGPLKPLASLYPVSPKKDSAAYQTLYICSFPAQPLKQVRLKVQSIQKLPPWHKGKGEKGWVFVDELFLQ